MEARLISPAGAASLSMTGVRDAAARVGGTLWLDFDHTDEDCMALLGVKFANDSAAWIVGLYVMNFANMPELGWRWGYPAVLVLMLIVGVLLVLLFRRRGWL